MKIKTFSVLFISTLFFTLSAFAGNDFDQSDLRYCIKRYDQALKRRSNVEKLEEVIEEINENISHYRYQLNQVDQALSHTIGYRRTELITEYNSLVNEANRFAELKRTAVAKRNKRIDQYNAHVDYVDEQCSSFSISDADWDAVCAGESGFCADFD